MKVLLLGSTGLLGQAVAAVGRKRGHDITGAARTGADLTLDVAEQTALDAALERIAPDVAINCAAIVDLFQCEEDPGLAYRINARPAAILATWSQRSGRPFVQISTDHFFTGEGERRHRENDPVVLLNEYARTKFAAEEFALTARPALILRTSIVGVRGWPAPTLAEWAIRSLEAGQPITLFADAFTSSIDVGTLAKAIFDLIDKKVTGRLNVASAEVYSKEAFTRALAAELKLQLGNARTGSVAEMLPTRATTCGLDVRRAERLLGYTLPDMRSVVASVARQYKKALQE